MKPSLTGKNILITSGPTRAKIDAVRFLSNRSSGQLGSITAIEALRMGAEVTFIQGPNSKSPLEYDLPNKSAARLQIIPVETVYDLLQSLREKLTSFQYDAIIHAMAVLDYVPEDPKNFKIRSGKGAMTLRLVQTPKVISYLKGWNPHSFLIAFKLEKGKTPAELRDAAISLMQQNGADLAVANDIDKITEKQHPAIIVRPTGDIVGKPQTKLEIARTLCKIIARSLRQN